MRGNEIKKTPLIHSPTFSKLTDSEVYLKAEFRQRTGSLEMLLVTAYLTSSIQKLYILSKFRHKSLGMPK